MEGYSLSLAGCVVLDGDVAEGDVAAFNLDGIGAESSYLGLLLLRTFKCGSLVKRRGMVCSHRKVGMVVIGNDGLVAVFADNLDVGEPRGDDDLLLVCAFLDEDHLFVFHEGSADLYGIVEGMELGTAVFGNIERVGVVVLTARCCFACG